MFVEGPKTQVGDCNVIKDDGHNTPYANTSDDDQLFEDGTDAEGEGSGSQYLRFSKKDAIPKFALGMNLNFLNLLWV